MNYGKNSILLQEAIKKTDASYLAPNSLKEAFRKKVQ